MNNICGSIQKLNALLQVFFGRSTASASVNIIITVHVLEMKILIC